MKPIMCAAALAVLVAGCSGGTEVDADGDGTISSDEAAEAAANFDESVRPEAGQYRASIEVLEVDIPGAPPQVAEMMKSSMSSTTSEFCLTEEQAARGFEEMAQQGQEDCTYDKFEVDGGSIDAAMTCKQAGNEVKMTVVGTGGRTSSEMTMTMTGDFAGMGEGTMKMKTSQERIGDCS